MLGIHSRRRTTAGALSPSTMLYEISELSLIMIMGRISGCSDNRLSLLFLSEQAISLPRASRRAMSCIVGMRTVMPSPPRFSTYLPERPALEITTLYYEMLSPAAWYRLILYLYRACPDYTCLCRYASRHLEAFLKYRERQSA